MLIIELTLYSLPHLFPFLSLSLPLAYSDSVSGLQQLARGVGIPPKMGVAIVERLTIFSLLFNTYLSTLHDAEFFCEIEGQYTMS